MSARPPPATCANCGAPIPPGARACPECGADERTGWREASVYDGLDLPDTADDGGAPVRLGAGGRTGRRWYWILTGGLLAAGLILGALALG